MNESIEHEKHSEEAYLELRKARADSTADQELVDDLDPGGTMLAENAAARKEK